MTDETDKAEKPKKLRAKSANHKPPPPEYQFKPGNPGRPKGSRNKLGEHFIQDLYADWEKHGAAVIARVREDRPQDYLKVTASLLPKQVQVENKSELSDSEIAERIKQLAEFVDFATGSTAGIAGPSGRSETKERPN